MVGTEWAKGREGGVTARSMLWWALSGPTGGKGVARWAEEGPRGESEFNSELGERNVFTF